MCKGCHFSSHGAEVPAQDFLRRSRLGLPLDAGYVQSGQNAAPSVLEPGDSSETFQSLPLTLGDR